MARSISGQFYRLEHARMDTELSTATPPIWLGAVGPRMLRISGRGRRLVAGRSIRPGLCIKRKVILDAGDARAAT
jgi:hypothetical protein